MKSTKKLLSAKNIKTYFPVSASVFSRNKLFVKANENISLDIYEGETVGIVGESGSGKSTFGRTVLRLVNATSGEVIYYGENGEETDVLKLKNAEMRKLRKDLQIIFQDPYSSLDPRMTIGEIIEEGLITHSFFKRNDPKMKEYVLEVMKKCGLQDYMVNRYPHQFSGGQRQRVAIARALAVKPKFVVCDECVSALDVSIQSQIINLLKDLQENEGLTYLFISHDLSVVRYVSDKIGVMYLGSIVEYADAEKIFSDPRHPYTVALLSSVPSTEKNKNSEEKIILHGNIPSPVFPPSGCKFHTRCFMATEKCKYEEPKLSEVEEGRFVACHYPERKLDENGKRLFELKENLW